LPYARLLGAQAAIAAAAIFARYALVAAGPLAVSALRLLIAAAVAIGLALAFARRRFPARIEIALGCAGLALAVHFATWIASLQLTSVAISTLLVATTPLLTEMYDTVRERRMPSRRTILALILGAAGLMLIVAERSAPAPIAGRTLEGDLLAFAGAVAFAVYLVIVRDAGAQPKSGVSLPTLAIVARTYGWAAIALTIAAIVARQAPPPPGATAAWGGIIGMAIFSQLLGHTGLNAALRDFSPTIVGLTTLLEPVFAALLAAAIFGESVSLQVAVGGTLVLCAVALALLYAEPTGPRSVPGASL